MKKVISLMLVLVLVCALFIVPAHAHEVLEAEVMPRAVWCAECSEPCIATSSDSAMTWNERVTSCENYGYAHYHGYYYHYSYYLCTNSGCPNYNTIRQNLTSVKITGVCSRA